MSIFNEKQIKAMTSGRYICSECGSVMEFEDEWEDSCHLRYNSSNYCADLGDL